MKRSPLLRKTSLKRTGELKRTAMERGTKEIPKVNKPRAAKRRARDFGGPYGDVLIPRLPCCVCFPWWYLKTDEELRDAFADVLFDPERFAVVSEPAHFEHSRGAGGDASVIVPLNALCHYLQHSMGADTFAAAHPENRFPALASRLRRIWLTFNVREDECDLAD